MSSRPAARGTAPTGRPRRRGLPRTGPSARWPARAATASRIAVAALAALLGLALLLALLSPERYLRLLAVLRSLPVVVVLVVLLAGAWWFLLDAVRAVVSAVWTPQDPDRARRRLLLACWALWWLATLATAGFLLTVAAVDTFGTLP